MLIRSQNREVLVNFNGLPGIEIAEGTTKTTVTSYVTGCCYLLGEYSNKGKAVKVLDILQKAYTEHEVLLQMFAGIGGIHATTIEWESIEEMKKEIQEKAIFQMPEDSEVEV